MTGENTLALRRILESRNDERVRLRSALRYLAKYRSTVIARAIMATAGTTVLAGPFAGMDLAPQSGPSAEGCHAPKLIGCYESELHPYILEFQKRGYDVIINIGTSGGYYAVGMAHAMPDVFVVACDRSQRAQDICRELARRNGVAERIDVQGEFRGEDFAEYSRFETLVICDAEGAEEELLDPILHPALQRMDFIIELYDPDSALPYRFRESHTCFLVSRGGRDIQFPASLPLDDELDRLLAVWEWQMMATSWLVGFANQ